MTPDQRHELAVNIVLDLAERLPEAARHHSFDALETAHRNGTLDLERARDLIREAADPPDGGMRAEFEHRARSLRPILVSRVLLAYADGLKARLLAANGNDQEELRRIASEAVDASIENLLRRHAEGRFEEKGDRALESFLLGGCLWVRVRDRLGRTRPWPGSYIRRLRERLAELESTLRLDEQIDPAGDSEGVPRWALTPDAGAPMPDETLEELEIQHLFRDALLREGQSWWDFRASLLGAAGGRTAGEAAMLAAWRKWTTLPDEWPEVPGEFDPLPDHDTFREWRTRMLQRLPEYAAKREIMDSTFDTGALAQLSRRAFSPWGQAGISEESKQPNDLASAFDQRVYDLRRLWRDDPRFETVRQGFEGTPLPDGLMIKILSEVQREDEEV